MSKLFNSQTPVSINNALELLPLVASQEGRVVDIVEHPKGFTYTVDGRESGLVGPTKAHAARSACRLLLGRQGDVDAFLDQQEAAYAAKRGRIAAKNGTEE